MTSMTMQPLRVPECVVSLTCHTKETAEERTACARLVDQKVDGVACNALEAGLPVCVALRTTGVSRSAIVERATICTTGAV